MKAKQAVRWVAQSRYVEFPQCKRPAQPNNPFRDCYIFSSLASFQMNS